MCLDHENIYIHVFRYMSATIDMCLLSTEPKTYVCRLRHFIKDVGFGPQGGGYDNDRLCKTLKTISLNPICVFFCLGVIHDYLCVLL